MPESSIGPEQPRSPQSPAAGGSRPTTESPFSPPESFGRPLQSSTEEPRQEGVDQRNTPTDPTLDNPFIPNSTASLEQPPTVGASQQEGISSSNVAEEDIIPWEQQRGITQDGDLPSVPDSSATSSQAEGVSSVSKPTVQEDKSGLRKFLSKLTHGKLDRVLPRKAEEKPDLPQPTVKVLSPEAKEEAYEYRPGRPQQGEPGSSENPITGPGGVKVAGEKIDEVPQAVAEEKPEAEIQGEPVEANEEERVTATPTREKPTARRQQKKQYPHPYPTTEQQREADEPPHSESVTTSKVVEDIDYPEGLKDKGDKREAETKPGAVGAGEEEAKVHNEDEGAVPPAEPADDEVDKGEAPTILPSPVESGEEGENGEAKPVVAEGDIPPDKPADDELDKEKGPRVRPAPLIPDKKPETEEPEEPLPAPDAAAEEEGREHIPPWLLPDEEEPGAKPPPPPDDEDEGVVETDEKKEEGLHTITLVNRTADLEKRARELVEEQLKAAYLRGGKWKFFRRIGLKAGEEYFRHRGIARAKKAMIENNNVFLQTNVIGKGAKHLEPHFRDYRAQERAAAEAKLRQIALESEAQLGPEVQRVEETSEELGKVLTNEVLYPLMSLSPTADLITREKEVQKLLRGVVEKYHKDDDPANQTIRSELESFFGKNQTSFNEVANYFATDMLAVVDAVKADRDAHGWAIEELDKHVKFKLANTNWAADTKENLTVVDRAVAGAQRFGFNESTTSAIVAVGLQVFKRGTARALGAAVVTGGVFSALERNKNLKRDMASYRVGREYGEEKGEKRGGWLRSKFDARYQLEQHGAYDAVSVSDMLDHTNEDRRVVGGDARSLTELLAEDLSQEPNRQALILRIAEIKERLRFGATEKAGITQLDSKVTADQSRLRLVEGIVKGRRALLEAGLEPDEVDEDIRIGMSKWETVFTDSKDRQDKEFRNYRVRSALLFGAMGGASAFAIGVGSQWAMGEVGERVLDRPHNPTILEDPSQLGKSYGKFDNPGEFMGQLLSEEHKANDTAASTLREILSQVKLGGTVVGDINGFKFHTELNGNIVLDEIPGQKFDGKHAPELIFNPQEKTFSYKGHFPPSLEQPLEEAGFRVRIDGISSEMKPEGMKITVPDTKYEINIPKGTDIIRKGENEFELRTKDANAIRLADQIKFDKDGNIIHYRILEDELVGFDKGKLTEMSTGKWLKEHRTHIDKWGWYDEVLPKSDQNELMLYDDRIGKHAVKWDMSNMGVSTNRSGSLPPVNVQRLIEDNEAVMAFWDPDKARDPILVKATNGQVKLDQNDWKGTVKVYMDGKWKPVPKAELANIVFAKNLGDYQGASNATGHMDKFNMNVSAGMLVEKNGKTEFRSFATDLSRGDNIPSKITSREGGIPTFKSTQQPKVIIDIPDTFDARLLATAVTPRRAVPQGERPELETTPVVTPGETEETRTTAPVVAEGEGTTTPPPTAEEHKEAVEYEGMYVRNGSDEQYRVDSVDPENDVVYLIGADGEKKPVPKQAFENEYHRKEERTPEEEHVLSELPKTIILEEKPWTVTEVFDYNDKKYVRLSPTGEPRGSSRPRIISLDSLQAELGKEGGRYKKPI